MIFLEYRWSISDITRYSTTTENLHYFIEIVTDEQKILLSTEWTNRGIMVENFKWNNISSEYLFLFL